MLGRAGSVGVKCYVRVLTVMHRVNRGGKCLPLKTVSIMLQQFDSPIVPHISAIPNGYLFQSECC